MTYGCKMSDEHRVVDDQENISSPYGTTDGFNWNGLQDQNSDSWQLIGD